MIQSIYTTLKTTFETTTKTTIKALLLVSIAALCTACETLPSTIENEVQPKVYTGRFSVSFMKDGQTQREQGSFDWKVKPSSTGDEETAMQLAINSPLGNTLATIAFNPRELAGEQASLRTPTQHYVASTLDTLMQRTLGWRLPMTALLPWMSDKDPKQSSAEWLVKAVSRHDNGSPKVISADNAALSISARLVFDEFSPP
jgi:outer membrane biogenesis lipoprotein LolB